MAHFHAIILARLAQSLRMNGRASDTEVPPKRNGNQYPLVNRERGISLGILEVRLLKRLRQQRSGLAVKADRHTSLGTSQRLAHLHAKQPAATQPRNRCQATSGEGTTFDMRMRSVVVKYMVMLMMNCRRDHAWQTGRKPEHISLNYIPPC